MEKIDNLYFRKSCSDKRKCCEIIMTDYMIANFPQNVPAEKMSKIGQCLAKM